MKYRKMGSTGLKVYSFCLGTMTFCKQVEEKDSLRIIYAAIDAGVNFIDTADMYVNGRTEQIVSKALKGRRDSIVLASKVGHTLKLGVKWGGNRDSGPIDMARPKAFTPWPGADDVGPNDMGLSRKHIMQGVEASLRRLETDYLDIYYAHMPDYNTPLEETLRAMDDLVRQGKVRYLTCSNYRAFQLSKSLWISDKYNLARFDCIQPPYNLLARDIEYELLPLCATEGVGVCVFSPMAAGFLSGKYDKDKGPMKGARFSLAHQGYVYNQKYWTDDNFEAVAKLKQLAESNGRTLAQFALTWVLTNKTITAVVCGNTSIAQLEQNMAATEISLSEEELKICDDVWNQLRPPRLFYGR
jgi:aryl-alcohol dehydrogenase-like predicted oxidoreductase